MTQTATQARDALRQLERDKEALPAEHASAVAAGNFTKARTLKDALAALDDRIAYARLVLARAELAEIDAELEAVARAAADAVQPLELAFISEASARAAYEEAQWALARAQGAMQGAQHTARTLRERRQDAQKRLEEMQAALVGSGPAHASYPTTYPRSGGTRTSEGSTR